MNIHQIRYINILYTGISGFCQTSSYFTIMPSVDKPSKYFKPHRDDKSWNNHNNDIKEFLGHLF